MDVRAQIGDIRMLRRIVALLFALADVAEGVADRSLPVRWLVLTILRWAEPVARDFVARETGVVLPELEHMSPGGNGPADALLLAAQFRVMAVALDALISLECLFGREARQHRTVRPDLPRPGSRGARICLHHHAARDPPPPGQCEIAPLCPRRLLFGRATDLARPADLSLTEVGDRWRANARRREGVQMANPAAARDVPREGAGPDLQNRVATSPRGRRALP